MPISITNTLTGKKEAFQPLVPGELSLYVCGPTVYNLIHIGNARPLVFFDVVRRYMQLAGYKVNHVMNYTDVDDKIIERARKENLPWTEIVSKYIGEYETDMGLLGVNIPTKMPRVSDHIPQIISLIERLISNGAAYAVDGEVLFSVRNFKEYGKLSGKNVDDLLAGARVEVGTYKKDPLDFSLWKPQKAADEPGWDSPWGKGRPGWHIECSVMAMQYLGETFDIHGGGMDLIHPHHENEIAQSEAATKKPYVRYWMHNNMLNVNAEKMSKSIGNITLTRTFVEQYSAEVLKFMLLSGHYRSTIDFSDQNIRDSQIALHRYYSAMQKAKAVTDLESVPGKPSTEENKLAEFGFSFSAKWKASMEDDFNTAQIMGYVFEYVRAANALLDKKGLAITDSVKKTAGEFVSNMENLASVLNILQEVPSEFLAGLKVRLLKEKNLNADQIETLISQRLDARKSKDFQRADALRKQLTDMGVELKDKLDATDWDILP